MGSRDRTWLATFYALVAFLPVGWLLLRAGREASSPTLSETLARTSVQELLANSIYLALLTTAFALLLGLPLAFILERRRVPLGAALGLLYFLPLVIPPHIHAIAWLRVIGDQGWLTGILRSGLGWELDVRAPLGTPGTDVILGNLYPGPAWLMACAYFPLITLSVSAGLRDLDAEMLESARLGGGKRLAFRRVLLPLVMPRIVAGSLFVFVLALSTYPVVSLLDTPTLIQKVFFTFSQVDQGAGAVMALPLVGVAALAVGVLGVAERHGLVRQRGLGPPERRPAGWGSTAMAVLPLALAAGIPLVSLIIEAGPIHSTSGGVADNYRTVFERVRTAFSDSLMTTGLGVAALLLISYPVGRLVARHRTRWIELLSLSTLALPPVVVGVALVLFWTAASGDRLGWGFALGSVAAVAAFGAWREGPFRPGAFLKRAGMIAAWVCAVGAALKLLGADTFVVSAGIPLLVLALVARFVPFTVRLFRNGFLALDPEEEEAARLCGHRRFSRLVRIELPRMRGVVGGVAVMAYVLCFTELAATLMVLPPGWQSVQARIFNMVHYRSVGEVAALCVMVVAMAALPVILAGILSRRRWEVL